MNKSFTTTLFLFLFFLSKIVAQVSFTDNTTLLEPISSFYPDCAVDMNGDYLDDVVRLDGSTLTIDYQQPDGSFIHQTFAVPISNTPEWSICAGDIDNNGYNDLLFANGARVSFIYANSDGSNYTEDIHWENIFSQRSTFADINNDGHLDAFVCHDEAQSHPFKNDGNGNLILDQTLIETIPARGNYSAIWVDYDNDDDSDLYISKCVIGSTSGDPDRTNAMYRNNGDGTFTEVAEAINLADNAQSWTTVFEDFDNDGDFDAFIINHDFSNRFMKNTNGIFEEIIGSTGILATDLGAWEAVGGDFNNDGFIDILSQLSREIYLNNGNMTFTGYDIPFYKGGIGDFNNDGFLDVLTESTLRLNDGNENNWVKINTEGIISNKNGIGARVEIHGDWGTQIREVRAGQSFSPMSSLTTHFGIGTATAIDSIIVKWPSGIKTTIENPDINTSHLIPESSCLLAESEIIVSGNTNICLGDSVMLEAPVGFENYLWSNGSTSQTILVKESGVFSVKVFDANDCISISNTISISVTPDPEPVISYNGDLEFCLGGSIELNVSEGENPIWSNDETGQSINITQSGTYFVTVDGICTETPIVSEEVVINVLETPTPIVNDVEINVPSMVTLTASGENLEWYANASGGQPLGTGSSYETPFIDADQTFYVEAHTLKEGEVATGGKLDFEGNGGIPATGAHSLFDAFEPFTILSVTVMVPSEGEAGMREIQLVNKNDAVLQTDSFDLSVGTHQLELNFEVPMGNDFSLRCPQNNLFRNNGGVDYPYPIADVGSITTSSFGSSYYYYFYDWKIQKEPLDCASERVPIHVSILTNTDELKGLISQLSISPNPANDRIYINLKAEESNDMSIKFMDSIGKEFMSKEESIQVGNNSIIVDISTLSKGMYYLHFMIDGKTLGKKIVVQ